MKKLLAIVALVALAACGGDDDGGEAADTTEQATTTTEATTTTAAAECLDAAEFAPVIAEGFYQAGTLDNAQGVEFESPDSDFPMIGNMRYLVAGQVNGTVAVWATGTLEPTEGGPILAIDDNARAVSDWGAAAQPGSPARAGIDTIAAMEETAMVRSCVAQ